MQETKSKFNLIFAGLMFMAMVVTFIQLLTIQGNPEISELYLKRYLWLGIFSVFMSGLSIALVWVKEPWSAHLPAVADSSSYRLVPYTWLKFVIIILFTVVILFSVTSLKTTIVPVPHPIQVGFSVSPLTEAYYSSVIPALYEDFTFGWILPITLFNLLWTIFFFGFGIDLRANAGIYTGSMLVILLMSSIGYGFLLPGFATAHAPVYQDNIMAYVSATVFMFVQSLIYVVTGLFLPLAHLIHNLLFSLGFVVALSIGGISTGLIFLKLKRRKRHAVNIRR